MVIRPISCMKKNKIEHSNTPTILNEHQNPIENPPLLPKSWHINHPSQKAKKLYFP